MKDLIRITILGACAAAIIAVASVDDVPETDQPVTLTPAELSWVEFCRHKGYDPQTRQVEIIDEFLDTWRGSVEEEQAFNNLPAQEV
ncbi:MAG: hypothetical protein HDR98_09705 [Bacteroides sp.]|nr:hypothetical protein [Bacteroides sp.]